MIAVGSIVRIPAGRYRLLGFQPDGRLNLQDLESPNAFVLRSPDRQDLEVEAEPTGLEVVHVVRATPAAAPSLPPEAPPSASRGYYADPYPITTLGAVRPGKSLCTAPTIEVTYWRPCLRQSEVATEGELEGGGPHAFFIASNQVLNVFCPACKPDRIRVVEPVYLPPSTPWGDGVPIWERMGGARGAALFEWYEERAAIIEDGEGVTRRRAEDMAYQLLLARMKGSLFS
jgi:hypothetical protein